MVVSDWAFLNFSLDFVNIGAFIYTEEGFVRPPVPYLVSLFVQKVHSSDFYFLTWLSLVSIQGQKYPGIINAVTFCTSEIFN